MSSEEENTRKRILTATIELLRTQPYEQVTMRTIAKKAEVTLSSINYYFQSKEKLIDKAVKEAFYEFVGTMDDMVSSLDKDPVTNLKNLFKNGAKFIEKYPQLARFLIIRDLLEPSTTDSFSQTVGAYIIFLKKIFGEEKSEPELKILAHIILSAFQVAILRADVFKEDIGYDFANKEQREFVSNFIIDVIIKAKKG